MPKTFFKVENNNACYELDATVADYFYENDRDFPGVQIIYASSAAEALEMASAVTASGKSFSKETEAEILRRRAAYMESQKPKGQSPT